MPRRAFATEVIYIASANEPDFAFIRVQATDAEPLSPAHRAAEVGQPIAVVGYPASDGGRNDPDLDEEPFRWRLQCQALCPRSHHRTG